MSFKLQSQLLSVSKINFARQSFEGKSKLNIWPMDRNLSAITLNCNGPQINHISIHQPDSNIQATNVQYNRLNEDLVSVEIPEILRESVFKLESFSIEIEFTSIGNKCGLQFVIAPVGVKGDYMYCSPYNNAMGSTFPCVEFGQACEWWIEVIVPKENMVAVCSGNLVSKDDDVYIFHVSRATTARQITFAVGEFELYIDATNPIVGFYYPITVEHYVRNSTLALEKCMGYLKSNFGMKFPFKNYKVVFVDLMLEEHYTGASVTLLDIGLLHNNRVVEQMLHSSHIMAAVVCEQYVGAFVEARAWTDSWIGWGLAEHITDEFTRTAYFPEDRRDEALYEIKERMDRLVEYETRNGGIVLDASSSTVGTDTPFDVTNARSMPLRYKLFYRIKAGLVVRSWALAISTRELCEVVRHYLRREKYVDWAILERVPMGSRWGSLVDSLARKRGHITVTTKAHFMRKEKLIDLVVCQAHGTGSFFFSGWLDCTVQEPDGVSNRILRVNGDIVGHVELETCSKISHFKTGQKLVTRTRDEIDGPSIGWVHIDPDMRLVGRITNVLTEEEATLMVRTDSNFWTKYTGLVALSTNKGLEHFDWLMAQIVKRRIPTRIRLEAIRQIRDNLMDKSSLIPRDSLKQPLVSLFCEKDDVNPVLRRNCWKYAGDYFVHLALVEAVSVTYVPTSTDKWAELLVLLLDMLEFAPCQGSAVSASHFRATVIVAIGNSFSLVSRALIGEFDVDLFVELAKKQLIEDLVAPSHMRCVMGAVLTALAKLQQAGLLDHNCMSVITPLAGDCDDDSGHAVLASVAALLTYVHNVEMAVDPIRLIFRYVGRQSVAASIRSKVLGLVADKLVSFKHCQNAYLVGRIADIFHGHCDALTQLTGPDNESGLRAAAVDLLYTIRQLKVPISAVDAQFITNSLDKPAVRDDIQEFTNVRHVMGEDDVNLSDDSD